MGFEGLGINESILKAVRELGFEKPTDIQAQAIPLLLQGKDLIGQARTGTGKTAAFAISILQSLHPKNQIQALVLEPTRELALQVKQEFWELGKYVPHRVLAIYGGEAIQRQLRELSQGTQIVVCTPGRLLDHIERRTINFQHVRTVVIDEADRMLDMGFIDDVEKILRHLPPKKQMLFFSATLPDAVISLAEKNTHLPEIVNASTESLTVEKIVQHYVMCDSRHKLQILLHLLNTKKPRLSIIFVRTKRGADNLHDSLLRNGVKAAVLHGNLSQNQRERSMHSFRSSHAQIMVATDIASRGIDVDDVELIVNYNMPEDALVYAHRIGRTARAGKSGEAISFVTNLQERRTLEQFGPQLRTHISELKIEGLSLPVLQEDDYRGHGRRPQSFPRSGHSYPRDDSRGNRAGPHPRRGNENSRSPPHSRTKRWSR